MALQYKRIHMNSKTISMQNHTHYTNTLCCTARTAPYSIQFHFLIESDIRAEKISLLLLCIKCETKVCRRMASASYKYDDNR